MARSRWPTPRTCTLPFPLFVKPAFEGSGKGITSGASATNRRQAGRAGSTTCSPPTSEPVLIETYLPGAGIHRRHPGQRRRGALPAHRRHELRRPAAPARRRSTATRPSGSGTRLDRPLEIFECPAADPGSAGRPDPRGRPGAYHALGCRDWCRVDVRCDAAGSPMVVELNPLPGHPARSAGQLLLPQGGPRGRDELRRADPDRGRHRLAPDQRPAAPGGGGLHEGRHPVRRRAATSGTRRDVAAVVDNVRGSSRPTSGARGHEAVLVPVAPRGDLGVAHRGPAADLIFNLCEGINGHSRYEDYVVAALELTGVPFTGCRPGRSPSATGSTWPTPCWRQRGVPVPRVRPGADEPCSRRTSTSRSSSSRGGRRQRRHRRRAPSAPPESALKTRLAQWCEQWERSWSRSTWPGREFNVGFVGRPVLPMSEIEFDAMPDGQLAHRDLRRQVGCGQPRGPRAPCRYARPDVSPELAERIVTSVAGAAWECSAKAKAMAGWTCG